MREVGLIDGATLANVLNNDQARLALADLIDKYLIGPTGVDSLTPLRDRIITIPSRTLSTKSIDSVVALDAVAVERVDVEHFIPIAAIAVVIGTGGDLGGRLASVAILSMRYGE